jgi:hypothetical protein
MLSRDNYSRFITVLITGESNALLRRTVEKLHAIWIRVDETLPWIELKGNYETRRDATRAAENCLQRARIKIVAIPEKKTC